MKKVPATWENDCQGKKDYDAELVSLSTRYWPRGGGFSAIIDGKWEHNEHRPHIKPSAKSAILLRLPDNEYVEIAAREFKGESFEEVKGQVEQWAEEQYCKIWSAVYLALQPKSAEALKLMNLENTEELLSHLKNAAEAYKKEANSAQGGNMQCDQLHLYAGRSYSAKNPLSASDLLRLAQGKPAKRTLKERYNALLCQLFGHRLVTDRWHRMDDGNWFVEKNYEIHLGCTRCRFVIVLDPKQIPESSES